MVHGGHTWRHKLAQRILEGLCMLTPPRWRFMESRQISIHSLQIAIEYREDEPRRRNSLDW